jgi:hypothetical protein
MIKRKKWTVVLITGLLAVGVIVGSLSYQVVNAQSPTATPAAGQTRTQPGQGRALGGGNHGVKGGFGYSDADLAAALGIPTDQLQAAYKTANTEALKEAVSQGLITQAQADQMAADTNAGGRLRRFGKPGDTNSIDYDALLAKALNISTDQLKTAQQKATTTALAAAVKAGTMTQAQADELQGMNALKNDSAFQTAMKSAYETAIQQAVSSGVITQAQADAILARFANGGPVFGDGFGGGGHGHGGRGGGGQQ